MVDISRRAFLRGRSSSPPPLRPPWAGDEASFTQRCTRCGDCLPACPQHILVAAPGGYPTVDFTKAECTFCGACATACRPAALRREEGVPPWRVKAVIGESCLPQRGVVCRLCGDYCEVRAIRFPPRLGGVLLPVVNGELCTGCGACVGPCPVGAVNIR